MDWSIEWNWWKLRNTKYRSPIGSPGHYSWVIECQHSFGFSSKIFFHFTKILAQNFLLLVSAIIFLKVELLAYGFFCGWFAIILQTLCGFSFGILLYAILKKQVPVIMSLIVVELIVSSLSGKQRMSFVIVRKKKSKFCSGFFWNYHGLTMLFQKLTIVLPHHSVSKLLFEVLVHGKIVVHNNVRERMQCLFSWIYLPQFVKNSPIWRIFGEFWRISTNSGLIRQKFFFQVWVGFLSPLFWMISTLVIYCVYTQSWSKNLSSIN